MFLQKTVISDIQHCAKIVTPAKEIVSNSGRKNHGLVYFLDGKVDYIYPQKRFSVSAGHILFLPKGLPYTIDRQTAATCIHIDFLTVPESNELPFAKVYPNHAAFIDQFNGALLAYKQKRTGYEAEIMSFLYKIIAIINQAESCAYFPKSHMQKLAPALEHINGRYLSGELRISELARLCDMSPRYFDKLFGAFYGMSPKEFILQKQLDAAKNMLVTSDTTLGDIAVACGFKDVYYFSKTFKKNLDVSPSEYRKINRVL